MRFVDRHRELQELDDFLAQKRAGLMVLYGRRRVGKTSLVSHWLDGLAASHQLTPQNVLFWTATAQSAASQLRDFSQALMALDTRLTAPPTPEFAFPTWDAALGYLADLANLRQPNAPLVVVIDDDPLVLEATGGLLHSWGCLVVTVRFPLRSSKRFARRVLPFRIPRHCLPCWGVLQSKLSLPCAFQLECKSHSG